MAFSPETYALLKGLIDGNGVSIESITETLAKKWEKANGTFPGASADQLEAAFQAASDFSVYSGGTNVSYGIGWFGYKSQDTRENYAIVFRATATSCDLCLAKRSTTGSWSLIKFV